MVKLKKLIKTVNIICLTFVISFHLYINVYSQSNPKLEVIVMFKPGLINLPENRTEAPVSEITISDNNIKNILNNEKVQAISKAFPNFNSLIRLVYQEPVKQLNYPTCRIYFF